MARAIAKSWDGNDDSARRSKCCSLASIGFSSWTDCDYGG